MGREYGGEEYNVGKEESNIIIPIVLRLLGKISRGKGDGNVGKKIVKKKEVRKKYQAVGNFIHPWNRVNLKLNML